MKKIVYSYHPETKEFLGKDIAYTSPLEKNVFLIPAYSTEQEPIQEDNKITKWNDENWINEVIPPEPQKSDSELLNEIKNQKITSLETNYIAAQKIQLQNGHTFIVNLRGDDFRDIERQVTAANILGKADILAKDLSGSPLVIRDIPKATWILFYGHAKKISVNNLILKNEIFALIKATQSINNIESININPFPAIQTITLNL